MRDRTLGQWDRLLAASIQHKKHKVKALGSGSDYKNVNEGFD